MRKGVGEIQIGFTAGDEDCEALQAVCDFLCGSENGAVRYCLREAAVSVSEGVTFAMKAVAKKVGTAKNPSNKHFRLRPSDQDKIRVICQAMGFKTDRDAIRFAIRFQSKRV